MGADSRMDPAGRAPFGHCYYVVFVPLRCARWLWCKFTVEWKLVECEPLEVISRLGGERSLPELGHSGLAAAECADFELPLFDLLC